MKEYYKVMSKKNQWNWKLKKKSMKPKMVLWKIKDTDKFLTSFTKKMQIIHIGKEIKDVTIGSIDMKKVREYYTQIQ